MSDNQSLEKLWQQQSTQTPNFDKLSEKFKAMRRRQWLYVSLDVLSCLFLVIWLYFKKEEMSDLVLIFISLMVVSSFAATLYLIWLRRFGLKNTAADTQSYLARLKSQYANNVKIGKLSKLLICFALFSLVAFYSVSFFVQDWDTAKSIKKAALLILFSGGFFYPMWLWSNRQIKKYRNELEKLTVLEQSMLIRENGAND